VKIAHEQLATRGLSNWRTVSIEYTTIGTDVELGCRNCNHQQHMAVGNETLTMQALYEHCWAHPSERVAYMHNKGSFHNTDVNILLRHAHMKSMFAPGGCSAMPATCSVCSPVFSPSPHFHTSGNMWVAQCEYIKRLQPPKRFEAMMSTIHTDAPPWAVGRDRWSSEHWVHSHPSVRPCDTYSGLFTWGYENVPRPGWNVNLTMAPRYPLQHYENFVYGGANASLPPFQLADRLAEWRLLYAEVPSKDSWIWAYHNASYADYINDDDMLPAKASKYHAS